MPEKPFPRACWHETPQLSGFREAARHDASLVEVEAVCSLISLGTELLVARGEVPPALQEVMAVPYQEGSLSLPVKYGYSMVGRVAEGQHQGAIVHLLHPHQERLWVKEEELFLLPPGLPPSRAALISNLETAVNAIWDSGVSVGDRVLVVGLGLIGVLVADLLHAMPGVRCVVAELRQDRLALANAWGWEVWDGVEGEFDLAFHASAGASGLQTALDALGREGLVVELSWYGTRTVNLGLGGSFHAGRKTIRASQVSQIPPGRSPRWDYLRRKQLVARLLADARFDRYLSHRLPFDKLPDFFNKARSQPPEGLSWLVEY